MAIEFDSHEAQSPYQAAKDIWQVLWPDILLAHGYSQESSAVFINQEGKPQKAILRPNGANKRVDWLFLLEPGETVARSTYEIRHQGGSLETIQIQTDGVFQVPSEADLAVFQTALQAVYQQRQAQLARQSAPNS